MNEILFPEKYYGDISHTFLKDFGDTCFYDFYWQMQVFKTMLIESIKVLPKKAWMREKTNVLSTNKLSNECAPNIGSPHYHLHQVLNYFKKSIIKLKYFTMFPSFNKKTSYHYYQEHSGYFMQPVWYGFSKFM